MNEPSIELSRLDYIARLLADTKKKVEYNKSEGCWMWADRSAEDLYEYHKGFATWLDAAVNAVEPYLDTEGT